MSNEKINNLRVISVSMVDNETGEVIYKAKTKRLFFHRTSRVSASEGEKYCWSVISSLVRGILMGKSLSVSIDVFRVRSDGSQLSLD